MRNLQGDKEKYSTCNETLHSYLREEVIEEANDNSNRLATFYLPHRHVWTASKSTQLRVVFDASSHAKDELSLNDVIYERHSLTPLIHEVLLQYRTHLYIMLADIEEAFLQIGLPESHRDVTRFLWVNDASKPAIGSNLKHFRLCRSCKPKSCILKHIEGSQSEISQDLSNSLYVDNVFLERKSRGDLLHKYTASKKTILLYRNESQRVPLALVNMEILEPDRANSTEIKVLGILWNAMRNTIPLKLFVDSSKRAYACSIYVTTTPCHGVEESRLFTAKSKIAPINKEQTIHRLELLSIFIGLGLIESTIHDSTIALCWMQGNRRLPPIVSTLVQKISLITKRLRDFIDVTIFHVPTQEKWPIAQQEGSEKTTSSTIGGGAARFG
ncbi:unnamed protein product [Heligmosomoides polygyrus]|uniref:Reverse transcriptase domain-containing protein n=1 Tax=Heligmosomoides polygyrus TaxID=6339 RepID=A0A3P8CRC0_HELPZ|nr:unnamed protein product [Heligmosomoides polygyrus]